MIPALIDSLTAVLDWLTAAILAPLCCALSQGLELLLLRPLALLQVPLPLRIVAVGLLVALLSRFLHRLLRVSEHEQSFQHLLAARKLAQRELQLLGDWRLQQLLYESSDREIDEEFNHYLAKRFALHGLVYLLPIFLTMAWLEYLFPAAVLQRELGHIHLIALPDNSLGLEGLSLGAVFLASYCTGVIVSAIMAPKMQSLRSAGQDSDKLLRVG